MAAPRLQRWGHSCQNPNEIQGCSLVVLGDAALGAKPLPPHSVNVDVRVVERVALHRLTQKFRNNSDPIAETAYVFPLMNGVSVSGFRVRFSHGRKIVGEVKEKEAARAAFTSATSSGRRAAMLQEDGSDVFRASIGTLAAGEEVEVNLEYCLELPMTSGVVRLTIPSHVGPRYCSQVGATHEEELCLATSSRYSSTAPSAAFTAAISVAMTAGVAAVESPTHDLGTSLAPCVGSNQARAHMVTQGLQTDLVVLIRPCATFEPTIVRELLATRGTEALMLNLVPTFDSPAQRIEAIFVLDCSGSMNGARIEQAKRAASIFLRSLPSGCFLNVVLFGSNFHALCNKGSVAYDETSLQEASVFIDGASANLGGTELFPPLDFVFKGAPISGTQRAIFLLTDGEVSDQQRIFDLVKGSCSRVYSIGIGSGVSTALVNGIARTSQGSAAFVQDTEDLEPVCVAMLQKATSPSITNVTIAWPKTSAFRSQTKPPPIFAGDAFSSFALYPERLPECDEQPMVVVSGDTAQGRFEREVPVPKACQIVEREGGALLHHLFARSLIKDIEEGQDKDDYQVEAVQLSVLYSVLCSYTAFVSVEQVEGKRVEKSMDMHLDLQTQREELRRCASLLQASCSVMTRRKGAGFRSWRRRLSASRSSAEELAVPAASVQHGAGSAAVPPMRSSNKHQDATLDSSIGASTASQMEKVANVVRLARFDGSYTPSQQLQQLTGINEQDSLAWAKKQWGTPISLPVLTTARVLAHLSGEYEGQRATWFLVSQKAEKWLNTQQPEWKVGGMATVDELVMAAASWHRS